MLRWARLACPGLVVVAVGRMAAAGLLPRNAFAGIRMPSTMRSEEAWLAGHRAAASELTIAGCGHTFLGLVAGVWKPTGWWRKVLSRISTAWLLGWLGVAIARANQAARQV